MADYVSIDYGYIQSIINSAVNTVNNNVIRLDSKVNALDNKVETVRKETMAEINRIRTQLNEMAKQAKFDAAYQRAMTEVIRIRQQLERDFGVQKQVRDNLLGILQATDLGLITEGTISRCTEELMISAPKYWLAPCLIALAAWISNNESLAKRAIAEACKRDDEKTSLLFALITRRVNAGRIANGKEPTNVCFEWLSRYFSMQNPKKMKSSIIAYVDCYTNGIFGVDKDNICAEYLTHWMDTLQASNPSFAEEQVAYWNERFSSFCNVAALEGYRELKMVSPQFAKMQDYLLRIDASERDDGIKSNIKGIMDKPINTEELINQIDGQLVNLVGLYEDAEEDLRNREQYLTYVEEAKGDEKLAEAKMKAYAARKYDAPVDFAKRLSESVFKAEVSSSAKKTAIKFMKPYISEAFKGFMIANKEAYPNEIELRIGNAGMQVTSEIEGVGVLSEKKEIRWSGKTGNAENREELVNSLKSEYNKMKEDRIACITDDLANKTKKAGIITCCFGFLIIPLIIGVKKIGKAKKMKQENEAKRAEVAAFYDKSCNEAIAILNKALDQRVKANEVVSGFQAEESNEMIEIA